MVWIPLKVRTTTIGRLKETIVLPSLSYQVELPTRSRPSPVSKHLVAMWSSIPSWKSTKKLCREKLTSLSVPFFWWMHDSWPCLKNAVCSCLIPISDSLGSCTVIFPYELSMRKSRPADIHHGKSQRNQRMLDPCGAFQDLPSLSAGSVVYHTKSSTKANIVY